MIPVVGASQELDTHHGGLIGGSPTEPGHPDAFVIRLGAYNRDTAPLLPYYEHQNKLVVVDGMAPVGIVAAAIDDAMSGPRV